MHDAISFEDPKLRLTSRSDILTAIGILRLKGYDGEDLVRELISLFYVDLDAYNEAVFEEEQLGDRAA